jgi:hypothetical protein
MIEVVATQYSPVTWLLFLDKEKLVFFKVAMLLMQASMLVVDPLRDLVLQTSARRTRRSSGCCVVGAPASGRTLRTGSPTRRSVARRLRALRDCIASREAPPKRRARSRFGRVLTMYSAGRSIPPPGHGHPKQEIRIELENIVTRALPRRAATIWPRSQRALLISAVQTPRLSRTLDPFLYSVAH